jgi:hypothetical protein
VSSGPPHGGSGHPILSDVFHIVQSTHQYRRSPGVSGVGPGLPARRYCPSLVH